MHQPESATPLGGLSGAAGRPQRLSARRWVARRLFGIAPGETSFARRGFRSDSEPVRERLEGVAGRFAEGYHAALEDSGTEALAARLEAVPAEVRGFAYEGAGMALALLDTLTPWRRDRLRSFLHGPADAHVYIVHIGAGWILGRLPLSPERLLRRFDPVLGWLALDGYGFNEGFFHWPRAVARQEVPAKVRGYARRAFDQGLGRSLWFVEGADPGRIQAAITAFPATRRGDLWSGAGLACAYAGGREPETVAEMLRLAAEHAPGLAQGAAFAAAARQRAGNPASHTELACRVFCGLAAAEAAEVAVRAIEDLPPDAPDGTRPAFEVWRRRIRELFTERGRSS
jgi:hypothetical protein